MRVKTIMLPKEQTTCIKMTDKVEDAIAIIDEHGLLSLPVVDEQKFIGVLSKQYLYEEFFKRSYEREEFLKMQVSVFMKDKVETITPEFRIEEVAAQFITSKARFIPITDNKNNLLGIVTQQAVFKQYQKMFGKRYNSLVIYSYDSKGTLAKASETVAKAGGDIRNMLIMHTDVMNLVEIFIRIDAVDFDKVVKALEKQGFDIRDVRLGEVAESAK
ncbi:MAG: CBS domain-containing protein [Lachnospiraceae bacterium]